MRQTKKRKQQLYGHIHVRNPNPKFWQVLKQEGDLYPFVPSPGVTKAYMDKMALNSMYGKYSMRDKELNDYMQNCNI